MDRLTVPDAIAAIAAGRMLILTDDAGRENEGDLVLAAAHATPAAVNILAREARGLICAPLDSAIADRFDLPLMVPTEHNTARYGTAFTVSVEAREGVTTGISAPDRAHTIQVLADPAATAYDLVRPGHIFPLRAHPGGVLGRPGHTEATVELCRLADLPPVAVLCEVLAPDGTMARGPELERLAGRLEIGILAIADLIDWLRARADGPTRVASSALPTAHGAATLVAYTASAAEAPHLALVFGDVTTSEPVLVRMHSECLTGDLFDSVRCDCGDQLHAALTAIGRAGRGVLLYLRQEGRGIGLVNKLHAYALQDQGLDTVAANRHLGLPIDARTYDGAAAILRDLGISRARVLTNNPAKLAGLTEAGITVTERVPLIVPPRPTNARYLATKRDQLGHWLTELSPSGEGIGLIGGNHAAL